MTDQQVAQKREDRRRRIISTTERAARQTEGTSPQLVGER
jgi:hypothetical protein